MKELVNARDALVKDRVAALNRQAIAVSPLVKRQLAQRLRQINGQIEAIDKHLKMLRNADSDLCQGFDILTSIPGLGEATANVLVVETPEPCESFSSSQTPSSAASENGPPPPLDQHGHYKGRLGQDRSPRQSRHSIARACRA
jgi:transposase